MEPRLIDCRHLGRERVIGCWQVGDTLIDPGPESCLETVLEAVEGTPRRLLLTHIHLDHAGASGALVERFPEIEVWVHEVGAPHLIDPSRLLASAERLYGGRMQELWGRVVAVPEERVRRLSGGERLEGGVEVAYTPGHASHHVSYLIDEVAYVGDVCGVRIPPSDFVLMPTPPPDIDVELWLDSLGTVAAWGPERLALTHFGAVDEPGPHIDAARTRLREWADAAQRLDREGFIEMVRETVTSRSPAHVAAGYEQAAAADQLYHGLERYWRKKAESQAEREGHVIADD